MWTQSKIRERLQLLQRKLADPTNSDDPNWLKRRIDWLEKRLVFKEKELEHKMGDKRERREFVPLPPTHD